MKDNLKTIKINLSISLRILRRRMGVKFDEIVPSDIPKIHGIDRVIHGPNSISPGPIENNEYHIKRPWYMHPAQDDNLMVLQGTRYVDIYDSKTKNEASFIITPDKIFKNDKLYYDGPAMLIWPAGIFHRIISGEEGSISVNFATRYLECDMKNNFNIYNLCKKTGKYECIHKGTENQPDLSYHYPNNFIKNLFKSD